MSTPEELREAGGTEALLARKEEVADGRTMQHASENNGVVKEGDG